MVKELRERKPAAPPAAPVAPVTKVKKRAVEKAPAKVSSKKAAKPRARKVNVRPSA
jgi:hypothetical protein